MKQKANRPGAIPPSVEAKPARAWTKVLGALGGPMLRLHHYREIRAKVLHDAMFMSDRQRGTPGNADCDSARR